MKKYTLTTGRVIHVFEDDMQGMVGESMTILAVADSNNNLLRWADVNHLLSLKDVKEIDEWQDMLSQSNYASAVAFCR